MDKKLQIRNSTAEFLIFTTNNAQDTIEVKIEDESVWLTQKLVAKLFDVTVATVNEHLKNIFKTNELQEDSVIRKFLITASDGKNYNTQHYNLDAIISLGYRINSNKATEFRQWATQVLKQFATRGYVLDNERLKNGNFLNHQYFKDLILEIRDIRESERNFYQQITDIYASALDYDLNAPTTKEFFSTVQNKLHWAIHRHTASELLMQRADHEKEFMGLTNWKKAPQGKILKSDVIIAKNYLGQKEIKSLNRIVTMYLDYAEHQAERQIPMTMHDWSKKLNAFLAFNEHDILENAGKVTAQVAKEFAISEFEKYKVIQNKSYQSDFDMLIQALDKDGK
ncbi:MAG: cell filamentation protein Fic [Arcobacter sp.]|nr:MAG: cell filamentation protein Fic [Arcobacter sp.]